MLEENSTLLTLNIESNLLTGTVVADICRAEKPNSYGPETQQSSKSRSIDFFYKMYKLIIDCVQLEASSNFGHQSRNGHSE